MFFCVYLNFSRTIPPPHTKKKGWASGYCTYVTDLKRNSWNCSHEYEYALKMQIALSKRRHFIEDNTHLYGSHKILRPLNPLNPELNPICYLLALLAHHFLHVSRISVKSSTLRRLMSYIYIYIYIWSAYS